MKNLILENISQEETKQRLRELYSFLRSKMPKIDRDPKVFFKEDQKNADDLLGKTGYYDPDKEEIHLFITDRHGKDILRSFAHEVIHHEQKCSGYTDKLDLSLTQMVDYASKNKDLRKAEIDAFKRGNMFFRDWTDRLKSERSNRREVMNEEQKIKNLVKTLVKEVLQEKYGKKNKNKTDNKAAVENAKKTAKEQARKDLKHLTGKDTPKEEQSDFESTEKLQENKNPHPELFQERSRVLNEAFTMRDEKLFNELVKIYTK